MLHVVTKGTGQPVVMLHGFAASHKYWNQVLAFIPEDTFQSITPDLLGFGLSNKPEECTYDADNHADMVVVHAVQSTNEPVILVGHSMGAMVAIRIAKLYPQLITKLVLINAPLFINREQANQIIKNNLPLLHRAYISPVGKALHITKDAKLTKTFPKILYPHNQNKQDLTKDSLSHTRISLLRSLQNTILEYQPIVDLNEIDTITKVIYSRDDRYFSQQSLNLLAMMSHVETVELSGGHQLPIQQAEAVAKIILV